MTQVDVVTQRNASSSEELSATAQELSAQAQALNDLLAFFKIEGDGAPAPAATQGQAPARRGRDGAQAKKGPDSEFVRH
jgi:methyl-accepting chemotaxis protein